jgi:hypothetical protein
MEKNMGSKVFKLAMVLKTGLDQPIQPVEPGTGA